MQINTEVSRKEGMYLYFPDGEVMDLSLETIKTLSEKIWNNPNLLPLEMRAEVDFKTCSVCPFDGQDVLCSAMKPLLPFLQKIEKFISCNAVTVVYVNKDGEFMVSQTDLQRALQYITNMSLFEYCENAKQFHIYFTGIAPFMKLEDAITRLILNIYWIYRYDQDGVKRVLSELRRHVTVTSQSCVKRLSVMCKSDAFKNAYAKTQIFTEFLSMDPETLVESSLNRSF